MFVLICKLALMLSMVVFSVPATWLQVHTRRRQQTQRRHSTRFQTALCWKLVLHATGHQSFFSDRIWLERNMKEYTRFSHLPSKSQTWISDGRFTETSCYRVDLLFLGVSSSQTSLAWKLLPLSFKSTCHEVLQYQTFFLPLCWLLKFCGLFQTRT